MNLCLFVERTFIFFLINLLYTCCNTKIINYSNHVLTFFEFIYLDYLLFFLLKDRVNDKYLFLREYLYGFLFIPLLFISIVHIIYRHSSKSFFAVII